MQPQRSEPHAHVQAVHAQAVPQQQAAFVAGVFVSERVMAHLGKFDVRVTTFAACVRRVRHVRPVAPSSIERRG